MAKHLIQYEDIQWNSIDYSKITNVKEICRIVKEYYWNNRPKGSKKSCIISSGEDYDFLIKAFSMYHTEWDERTEGSTKIDFYVAIPPEYKNESAKCFHLVLDGMFPNDSAISHQFSKAGKKEADILRCCRYAIRKDKDKIKKDSIGIKCKYTGVLLSIENINVHHSGLTFSEIAKQWIENHGGIDNLYKYVSPSINGGTITKFISKSLIEDFRQFHGRLAQLEAISKEAHTQIHSRQTV